jgi:drug/metabolite transporter (DMT)-like permease
MNDSLKAHLSLFSAQLIYALNYSIAKDLMPAVIQPFGLVLLRIAGACFLFWSLSFFIKPEKIQKKDFKKLFLMAIFGVVINQAFFILGLSLTQPINSAIIMISNPIIVIVFTLIILKERITILKVSGLLLGIAGAITLLLFKGNFTLGSETIKGDLFTLVNSCSWAIFVVMAKPIMQKYHTVTVMKWIFLFGLILFTSFGFNDVMNVNWQLVSSYNWFAICFVVVATTFFAYLLNTYALKALSPSVVSTYIYFQPFLATTFAILLGKDSLNVIKVVSAIFIILGVYLVSKKTKKV